MSNYTAELYAIYKSALFYKDQYSTCLIFTDPQAEIKENEILNALITNKQVTLFAEYSFI